MAPARTVGMASPGRSKRRGSTLIMALLLVIVLSVAVAGLFGMLGSERKALDDQEAQAGAYDIARSAYDRFLANTTTLSGFSPPTWTGPDSAYFTFGNGYAYVRVQRVHPSVSGGPSLYLVSSRGVRTAFRSGNTPAAERIYAQYAQFSTGSMGTLAAWTSLSGLQKSGGSGTISGADACGKEPAVGGVAVPTVPGYVQAGGSSVPNGSPNIVDMGPLPGSNSLVKINWAGIVGGSVMTPDITLPGGSWPSFSSSTYWPVIYVNQASEWSLPGDGRGLLIVKNDMKLSGSQKWDGIILVGGRLTSSGNNTVDGAVVTGLNQLLGQVVLPSDLGSGTKTFRYNSCSVASAGQRFSGLAPIRNTTIDNWPSY